MHREQENVRKLVVLEDSDLDFSVRDYGVISGLRRVAGVDISFVPGTDLAYAAIAVLSFPELKLVHLECEAVEMHLPYIPGYLAFRELPAIRSILDLLKKRLEPSDWPQVFLVDGNGQMHPRQAGVASHLGVNQGLPTIGCSKSFFRMDGLTSRLVDETIVPRLVQRVSTESQPSEPVIGRSGATHGHAVLNRRCKNPVFVSVGHRISLESALAIVKACSIYRVPEPIRMADKLSRERAQSHVHK